MTDDYIGLDIGGANCAVIWLADKSVLDYIPYSAFWWCGFIGKLYRIE